MTSLKKRLNRKIVYGVSSFSGADLREVGVAGAHPHPSICWPNFDSINATLLQQHALSKMFLLITLRSTQSIHRWNGSAVT